MIAVVGAGGTPAVRELACDMGIVGLGRSFACAHRGRSERRPYDENSGLRIYGMRNCEMPR
jgi:hypothetical protein